MSGAPRLRGPTRRDVLAASLAALPLAACTRDDAARWQGGWIGAADGRGHLVRDGWPTTIEAAGLTATPYHAHVPSFGEWGFIVAGHRPFRIAGPLPPGLRFLTAAGLPALFDFPPDMARVPAEVNRLSNQVLVQTFEDEWGKVQR